MPEKVYFCLLILCGIWSQGIIGTFADEKINESSDLIVRHKRVISFVPGEDPRMQINQAPYVVIIRHMSRIHCTGSILSTRIVITAASCVLFSPNHYQISAATSNSNRGKIYDPIDIKRNLPIALVIIGQPFGFSAYCQNIELHVAPLLPGMVGKISGWGYNWRGSERGTNNPEHLRTIEVPIMSHRDCVNRYRPHIQITEKDVCTYHPQKHSGHTDIGAGLVVDGYLAGVFLRSGIIPNTIDPQYPEVFAILQHSDYNQWIRSNMREISIQFQYSV